MKISPLYMANKVQLQNFARRKTPVYAIDSKGNYRKYSSQTEASMDMGINTSHIHEALAGKNKASGGYGFVYANKIEKTDDNNNIVIDENVIKEVVDKLNSRYSSKKKPVYVVDNEGNVRRYKGLTDAANDLNIKNTCTVSKGNRISSHGYRFISASEVETDNCGEIKLNKSRLNDLKKAFCDKAISKAIYAVDSNGNYRKYISQADFAKSAGISKQAVHEDLKKGVKVKGQILIKASEVEHYDENGNLIVDRKKINKIFNQRKS